MYPIVILFCINFFQTLSMASFESTETETNDSASSFQEIKSNYDGNDVGRVLSRKRRFLVFPEGSSLQLVYCLTMPSVAMADFFVFGWTASLAWELPSEPYIGVHKEKKMDDENNQTENRIDISSNKKKLFQFKKKPTYYSTLNKYGVKIPPSTYSTVLQVLNKNWKKTSQNWGSANKKIYDDPWYSYNSKSNYLAPHGIGINTYHDPVYREVHRRTRRELYPKIEKFLSMQQKDGKACLLKAICEITKLSKGKEKGSFMQEILRVLFRIKEFHDPDREHDKYDLAANEEHDCNEMYRTCDASVYSLF